MQLMYDRSELIKLINSNIAKNEKIIEDNKGYIGRIDHFLLTTEKFSSVVFDNIQYLKKNTLLTMIAKTIQFRRYKRTMKLLETASNIAHSIIENVKWCIVNNKPLEYIDDYILMKFEELDKHVFSIDSNTLNLNYMVNDNYLGIAYINFKYLSARFDTIRKCNNNLAVLENRLDYINFKLPSCEVLILDSDDKFDKELIEVFIKNV